MSKTLGRGLSSLIPDQKSNSNNQNNQPVSEATWLKQGNKQILEVSPQSVVANPYQPRQNFSEEHLKDLMESIKEHGILQPLVVTSKGEGKYELVAGERRLRAAQLLKMKSVPIIVRTAGELEKLELSLIENIQRQDLNPIERAEAYKKLIDEFSLTHEQAAKRMGKSRPVISNTLRLLDLPVEVQKMIAEGRLHESSALAILELDDSQKQLELARQIATEKLTKEESRRLARRLNSKDVSTRRTNADPVVRSLQAGIESKLQTKVKIGRRGKKAWLIEIIAYSKEELEDIASKIIK